MKTQVLAIYGGKGGIGKSVIASNLSILLQQESRQPVLLFDADATSAGDQQLLFGLHQQMATLSSLNNPPAHLEELRTVLAKHPSGVTLLTTHREVSQRHLLTVHLIDAALNALEGHFAYIVVDCGNILDPIILRIFERATAIFVVTNPEILVIHQTKRALEGIQSYLFPKEMIQIIVNRMQQKTAITPAMIQANLNHPLLALLAEDDEGCTNALMRGQPVALVNPRSPLIQSCAIWMQMMRETKLLERLAALNKPRHANVSPMYAGHAGPAAPPAGSIPARSLNKERRLYSRATRHDIDEDDPVVALKLKIHKQLSEVMDLKKLPNDIYNPKQQAVLREQTKKAILDIIENEKDPILSELKTRDDRTRLVKEILDEALGLGPLEEFLADDSITEIMVNNKDQIYIEREGKLTLAPARFLSDAQLLGVIERIVTPLGRRIDEKTPYVDARLPDGSRVHAIIPPLAIQGPTLTIRKFSKESFTCRDLVQFSSMSPEMAKFFKACIEARLNIIVSGGTSSGKTSLLNALAAFIPSDERIVTVEDSAELQLPQPHICRLEARPANIEGEGAVTIRDLVKNTLRMRPDRIVVGECRSAEALDMLQAMNTGHDGSLTTIHANSPRDCLSRLETLILMAELDLPTRAIREQISSAIDLIVQTARLSDGSRKITSVCEVVGMEGEIITLQEIFSFKQQGVDAQGRVKGHFATTGMIPKFFEKFEQMGVLLPRQIFQKSA